MKTQLLGRRNRNLRREIAILHCMVYLSNCIIQVKIRKKITYMVIIIHITIVTDLSYFTVAWNWQPLYNCLKKPSWGRKPWLAVAEEKQICSITCELRHYRKLYRYTYLPASVLHIHMYLNSYSIYLKLLQNPVTNWFYWKSLTSSLGHHIHLYMLAKLIAHCKSLMENKIPFLQLPMENACIFFCISQQSLI